ncbi:hypothetical protein OVS_02780 [Mycoplasma ovis str. Michigan]|uniref:DUF31 domain-containing protein n=1 Tax=Mycoplasma ovis str. Michigan TaxID=1415773 RepID=A0ABM5P200_9MOLU|nr:trypsin-like peptidase domain-containing protein [Mycoplasma ovis]AHC40355.1 hypothetical protein OVS_02780 [Mycoplasma ovis str. Michigan]
MQIWKWGISSAPVFSGLIFGVQQVTQSSSESTTSLQSDLSGPPQQVNSSHSDDSTLEQQDSLEESRLQDDERSSHINPVSSKLDHYTLKLVTPCNYGTGWILDYQIPQKDHYPTVWYIATAAHVVNRWKFDGKKNNNYDQELPKSCKHVQQKNFELSIVKVNDKDKSKPHSEIVSQAKIKKPKLFWTALNLFNKESKFDIQENNFKDFAVIEVTFDSEEIAKKMTNNFADKYKEGSFEDAIDVFGSPLDPNKTKENTSRFYSLGYPDKRTESIFFKKDNWSWKNKRGDVLSNDQKNKYGISPRDKVRGFLSAKHFQEDKYKFNWGGKKYNEFGHFYYTQGTKLGAGASGSMVVDENGNLLGVRAMEGEYSLFTPLRAEETILGEIKTPKYDLILGAEKQNSSYKQQVEKHLLTSGKRTWLSSVKNWTNTKQVSK